MVKQKWVVDNLLGFFSEAGWDIWRLSDFLSWVFNVRKETNSNWNNTDNLLPRLLQKQ